MTLTEAAACGTPSVATAIAGHADAVVDGESGILVDDADDLQLAAEPSARRRRPEGSTVQGGTGPLTLVHLGGDGPQGDGGTGRPSCHEVLTQASGPVDVTGVGRVLTPARVLREPVGFDRRTPLASSGVTDSRGIGPWRLSPGPFSGSVPSARRLRLRVLSAGSLRRSAVRRRADLGRSRSVPLWPAPDGPPAGTEAQEVGEGATGTTEMTASANSSTTPSQIRSPAPREGARPVRPRQVAMDLLAVDHGRASGGDQRHTSCGGDTSGPGRYRPTTTTPATTERGPEGYDQSRNRTGDDADGDRARRAVRRDPTPPSSSRVLRVRSVEGGQSASVTSGRTVAPRDRG